MAEKIIMVALTPTMKEGHIVNWIKQEGDSISVGDVLCEVETDKAVMDYESDVDGFLLKILIDEGKTVVTETAIAICGEQNESIDALMKQINIPPQNKQAQPHSLKTDKNETQDNSAKSNSDSDAQSWDKIKISPLARRLSQENQISLDELKGSGPGGRIIRRDVESYLKSSTKLNQQPNRMAKKIEMIPKIVTNQPALENIKLPLSEKRKTIATRLTTSKFSAPHYYLKVSVCMDTIIESRQKLNSHRKSDDRISMNAFLIKLIAQCLKKHPTINVSWQDEHILLFAHQDVALAVAQNDGGLITPIVRHAGDKGIIQIDTELKQLIHKARQNSLAFDEFSGASFSVSNLGSFGVDEFTAIINPPAAAILAIGKIQKQALVMENEQLGIASMMTMTLSCDHRAIDGANAARFLSYLKEVIETPISALY